MGSQYNDNEILDSTVEHEHEEGFSGETIMNRNMKKKSRQKKSMSNNQSKQQTGSEPITNITQEGKVTSQPYPEFESNGGD